MAVDTTFSEEGEAFRTNMRRFFLEHSPLEKQRVAADSVVGLPDYWAQFARLDLLSLGLPGPDGSTAELVDLFPLYLEAGRALATSPHLATSMTALPIIAKLDHDQRHTELISQVTRGERIVVTAFAEAERAGVLSQMDARAERSVDGWTLFGQKVFVPFANEASHILIAVKTSDVGHTAFVVPASDVTITYMNNVSHYPLFQIELDGVAVSDSTRVGAVGAALAVAQEAVDRAMVLQCAEIVGAGERVLELCVDYAQFRRQFGAPIGTFQAVQYLCTDIAIMTRVTFLLALQCASKMDHGEPYIHELGALRQYAKRAASVIVSRAQEVHAGVAFMDEYDLHLFTRRSLVWRAELGDDEQIVDALTVNDGTLAEGTS